MKVYFPLDGNRSRIRFFGSCSVIQYKTDVCVGEFDMINHRCFIRKIDTVTFKKKTPQYPTDFHAFYEIGRIDSHLLESNIVYFYFSFKQRHSLYMHIETPQCEQCIRNLNHFDIPNQQVQREAKIDTSDINLHTGSFRCI